MARERLANTEYVLQTRIFFKNSFITIQLFYILSNQGKYDELNLIGSVHTGLVYCVPLGRLNM